MFQPYRLEIFVSSEDILAVRPHAAVNNEGKKGQAAVVRKEIMDHVEERDFW